jgi:L-ascorbate metabolism protein UlaG (beta-lactamase superfamily)
MITPFQQDETLLRDIWHSADQAEGFRIWWLGQSGFLLQWQGKHLLFDPYLSDTLTEKYKNTDKPHERVSERVIDPGRLDMIDWVTSSHNHTDHLDAGTLHPLFAASPSARFIIPEANRAFVAERLGCDPTWPVGSNDGWQYSTDQGFIIHGLPAAHNQLEQDERGCHKYMGFIVEFGPYRVYHSGDTLWYEGLTESLRAFNLDVALLPINGNKPERRVAGNLNYEEAARLGRDCGAKLTIPHHYDMFAFNTEDPANFVRAATEYGTPHRVLRIGEGIQIGTL